MITCPICCKTRRNDGLLICMDCYAELKRHMDTQEIIRLEIAIKGTLSYQLQQLQNAFKELGEAFVEEWKKIKKAIRGLLKKRT